MHYGVHFVGMALTPILAGISFLVVLFFLFNFLHMSSTPFKAMKAIYVYIAALIGLVVVATGVYGMLEYLLSILFFNIQFDAAYIITPIARIITGLFIMIPHWGIGHHFHLLEHKKRR